MHDTPFFFRPPFSQSHTLPSNVHGSIQCDSFSLNSFETSSLPPLGTSIDLLVRFTCFVRCVLWAQPTHTLYEPLYVPPVVTSLVSPPCPALSSSITLCCRTSWNTGGTTETEMKISLLLGNLPTMNPKWSGEAERRNFTSLIRHRPSHLPIRSPISVTSTTLPWSTIPSPKLCLPYTSLLLSFLRSLWSTRCLQRCQR